MAAHVGDLDKLFVEGLCAADGGRKNYANARAIHSLKMCVLHGLVGTCNRKVNEAVQAQVVGGTAFATGSKSFTSQTT